MILDFRKHCIMSVYFLELYIAKYNCQFYISRILWIGYLQLMTET